MSDPVTLIAEVLAKWRAATAAVSDRKLAGLVATRLNLHEERRAIIDPHWTDWRERITGYERRWVSDWTPGEAK